jgi:hypothetical protein
MFFNSVELIRVENKSFSNKYFEWWTDASENVFIRIDNLNKRRATVYCKNKDTILALYKEYKPAIAFLPSY